MQPGTAAMFQRGQNSFSICCCCCSPHLCVWMCVCVFPCLCASWVCVVCCGCSLAPNLVSGSESWSNCCSEVLSIRSQTLEQMPPTWSWKYRNVFWTTSQLRFYLGKHIHLKPSDIWPKKEKKRDFPPTFLGVGFPQKKTWKKMKADTNSKTNSSSGAGQKESEGVRHIMKKITLFWVTKMGVGDYDVMLYCSQHIIHFLI